MKNFVFHCSPFFERIFSEHPCKHPVIVLKDFPGREITALIDFMYRGEVRVDREDLSSLMHAAESLQIRGLASSDSRGSLRGSPPETPTTDVLLGDDESARQILLDGPLPEEEDDLHMDMESHALSPTPMRDHSLPHMGHLNFNLRDLSPLMPRRKQARPRRRSGEIMPQDLSKQNLPQQQSNSDESSSAVVNLSSKEQQQQNEQQQIQQTAEQQRPQQSSPSSHQPQQQQTSQPSQHQPQQESCEEVAENLSMKREPKNAQSPSTLTDHIVKSESEAASSPRGSPMVMSGLHPDAAFADLPAAGLAAISSLTLSPSHHHGSEYLSNLGQLAAQWLPGNHQNHMGPVGARLPREGSPLGKAPGYHYPQTDGPMPPRNFPMDGIQLPPGLFSSSASLEMHDSFKPENLHNLYMSAANLGHHHTGKKPKKHRGDGVARRWSDHARSLAVCRPKGQHSAPRGGPPRSWTNADLTEALTMVWNKTMTTSQASRVYGIPYNSLLMYVRGKYGKSLKLEQLRKNCIGELINNNNVKALEPPPQSARLPALPPMPGQTQAQAQAQAEAEANFAHHQLLSQGLAQAGFFPDFAGFPVPVNMVHLLPPSEQQQQGGNGGASNGHQQQPPPPPQQPQQQAARVPEDASMPSTSRSPSPVPMNMAEGMMPPPAQSAPALLQQNGSEWGPMRPRGRRKRRLMWPRLEDRYLDHDDEAADPLTRLKSHRQGNKHDDVFSPESLLYYYYWGHCHDY